MQHGSRCAITEVKKKPRGDEAVAWIDKVGWRNTRSAPFYFKRPGAPLCLCRILGYPSDTRVDPFKTPG